MAQICKKSWIQLAVGTVGMMLMGIAYAWSLFVTPLETALEWNRSQTSLVFTLSMIFNAMGAVLSGALSKRFSHKVMLSASAALFGIGFFCSSLIHTPGQLNISYRVFVGLATGIGYNTITYTVNSWFEGRIGMSSGMLFMGFGSGSFLFAGLINLLEERTGWIGTFRILAVIMFLALALVTSLLFILEKEEKTASTVSDRDCSTPEMLKKSGFWSYYIWAVFIWAIGLSIIGNTAVFLTSIGGGRFAVLATGVVSVTNGLCRVLMGRFYDRMGSRPTIFAVSMAMTASTLLFQLAFRMNSIPLVMGALFLGAIGCGGIAPTNSAFIRDCFGKRYYASNLGMLGTFGMFSSLAGSFVVGRLFAMSGNYRIAMIPLLVYAAIAMCEQWMIPSQRKKIAKQSAFQTRSGAA
ncbi:MAG: MFS transporter [Clostridia bacterium]|nr:MFS transporter [Clostridia bacterium]